MFKFNNKNTRTTSLINNFIADFEQVNVSWVNAEYDNAMTYDCSVLKI